MDGLGCSPRLGLFATYSDIALPNYSPTRRLVSGFVEQLKVQFPGNDFQVVKIAKKRYNVIPRPQASA